MACSKAWCRSDTVHWYLCRCFLSHRACRSRKNAAFVVAERAIIFRTVLSSILPPEAGPDGRSRGERRPPGRRDLPSSRILCVLDTRTSVPHSANTVQILGQIFQGWDSWAAGGGARGAVGPLNRALLSRAAGAGHRRTADAGLSRLRPRHPARVVRAALARRNPPTLFVFRPQPWRLTTPPKGSRARSLHGPRHTSPCTASPPIERPGHGSHTRTICRPGTGCSRTSPGGLQKNKPPGWWSSQGTWCISALRSAPPVDGRGLRCLCIHFATSLACCSTSIISIHYI